MKAYGKTERVVEIPWLIANLGKPKTILDIGSADALYLSDLQATGADVWCIDTRKINAPPGVHVIVGNFGRAGLTNSAYDLITCISVLDHVGLDAYGNKAGGTILEVFIADMHHALNKGGALLLTVPCGHDCVTTHPGGAQRIFDRLALSTLFPAILWEWEDETYWILAKDEYLESIWSKVESIKYQGYRAGAAAALRLVKK